MGIRCSLTGHVWSDIQSDMDKEIKGDEIAVTEIEYQECTRCDERRTISENTEVRSMGGDDEGGKDEGGNPAAANVVNEVFSGGSDGPKDDAVIMDDSDEETGVQEGVEDADEEGVGEEEMEERRREFEGAEVSHAEDDAEGDEESGPTVFACPRCSFESPSVDTSLREGDICPECGEGYIEERPS